MIALVVLWSSNNDRHQPFESHSLDVVHHAAIQPDVHGLEVGAVDDLLDLNFRCERVSLFGNPLKNVKNFLLRPPAAALPGRVAHQRSAAARSSRRTSSSVNHSPFRTCSL